MVRFLSTNKLPAWMNREDEEVIEIQSQVGYPEHERTLFDSILVDSAEQAGTFSVAELSLFDISESYGFSLAYLGDFLIQMGCSPPIDPDAKLYNILTADKIYTLMEAINTLDPFETNEGYDSVQVSDIANEQGLSTRQMVRLCRVEGVNLPFGLDSTVHVSVAERIRELIAEGEYLDEIVDVSDDDDDDEMPESGTVNL
jgi:hypothetical protein